jgi:hypothetical protein
LDDDNFFWPGHSHFQQTEVAKGWNVKVKARALEAPKEEGEQPIAPIGS